MILELLYKDGVSPEQFEASVIACIEYRSMLRSHPILGGLFGQGAFHLATATTAHGVRAPQRLHVMVIHYATSYPIAVAETRAEALQKARSIIRKVSPHDLAVFFGRIEKIQRAEVRRRTERKAAEEAEAERARRDSYRLRIVGGAEEDDAKPRHVSRRRRAIFEKSGGKCHYCACTLELTGRWHVEHMIPRALGGQSVDENLVASCAPCNHKKLDKTDHEFIAQQQGRRA